MTCSCHAGPLYSSLVECPACGHKSLDRLSKWEGCERRRCGYERTLGPPTSILTPLQAEVLRRMESLGRTVTASHVAWHGERLSTGVVWAALEALWEAERVEQVGAISYRLPPVRGDVHEPMVLDVGE